MAALARAFAGAAVVAAALLILACAGQPAGANHPIDLPAAASLSVSNVNGEGSSSFPQTGCAAQNLQFPVEGLTTYLIAGDGGMIDGRCDYSDSFGDTDSTVVSGSIDFEDGTVQVEVNSNSVFHEQNETFTASWNGEGTYDPVNHQALGSGTWTWSCNGTGCPGTDSGGGTLQWGMGLTAISSADLTIDHIEVVQVVQDAANSVPLVARKSTVARVFVKGSIPLTGVELTLKGKRAGDLPGTPQLISGGTGALVAPVRTNTDDSYNFLLPDEWTTEGGVTLEAEVKPPPGVTDPDEDNNKGSATVTFQERNGLVVSYLPVCVQPGGTGAPSCPSQFVASYHRFMEKLFPMADGSVLYRPLAVPQWNWPKAITDNAGNYEVNAALRKRFDLIQGQEGFVPDQLAGWLPRSVQNPLYGLADPLWFNGGGRISVQQDTRDLDPMDPSFTLAHEIAHNLGRRHPDKPDSCNARDGGTDWPYSTSTIQEIGFDMEAKTVVPASKKDVMTYCSPPTSNIWISPHTYTKLFEGNFQPAGLAAGGIADYLVISGSAKADGSGGALDPAYVISSDTPGAPSDPNGTHCLRFEPFIVDYCFTLELEEHRTHEMLTENYFSVKVPLPAGSTSVTLVTGATELARLDVSPSAPVLDVTTPSGDWTSGAHAVQWSASDADGDPVLYTVLYSPDGGTSWLPIEVDTPASQFTFDVAALEASEEGMFRVLASDGLNTSVDTTPPVQVGQIAPKGDVDCSGARTSVDALVVLQLASNLVDSAPCEEVGDVNCDMDVNSLDALFILQDISGFDVALPAGCPSFD